MRAYLTLPLVAALLSPARAEPTQTKEIFRWKGPPAGAARVELRNVNGAIRLRTASGADVEVTATATFDRGANPDALKVTRKGLTFQVEGEADDVSVDLEVAVPRGLAADATTVNGAIESATIGPIALRTTNGSIRVRAEKGDLEVMTGNGRIDVTLHPSVGKARLRATNGPLKVTRGSGGADVDASTVNGQIVVEGRPAGQSFRGHLGPAGGTRLQAGTVNGSIDLR